MKKNILVGHGQYVGALFVVQVVTDLHTHRFEVYTLVSENHDTVDMVMGIRNVYEIEGIIGTRNLCLYFLNRSIPFFPIIEVLLRPEE